MSKYSRIVQLSQQYHPDINKEPGAREKFQKVNEAWEVLKDGRQK
jgi:molecular chaperone DnaJ